jgi:hypothetical protein
VRREKADVLSNPFCKRPEEEGGGRTRQVSKATLCLGTKAAVNAYIFDGMTVCVLYARCVSST